MITRRELYVTPEQMNDILKRFRRNSVILCDELPERNILDYVYIEDRTVQFSVTVRDPKPITYITRKDSKEIVQGTNGAFAYRELSKEFRRKAGYSLPQTECDYSARAIIAYRNDYNRKRVQAFGYDMNSAYAWGLCQDIPDTREVIGTDRIVQEGEIGFSLRTFYGLPGWELVREFSFKISDEGELADIVFRKVPSPFIDFSKRWYERKINAKTEEEKAKAKGMLTYSVGYLQRKNPYLRALVIDRCNKKILSLIDDNSIYCNTDCIVSLEKRDDIVLSSEMGDFKLEHEGDFAFVGTNTQWNKDRPSYRGVPNNWFKDGYDILKDAVPANSNDYVFDKKERLLVCVNKDKTQKRNKQ